VVSCLHWRFSKKVRAPIYIYSRITVVHHDQRINDRMVMCTGDRDEWTTVRESDRGCGGGGDDRTVMEGSVLAGNDKKLK